MRMLEIGIPLSYMLQYGIPAESILPEEIEMFWKEVIKDAINSSYIS